MQASYAVDVSGSSIQRVGYLVCPESVVGLVLLLYMARVEGRSQIVGNLLQAG